MEEVECFDCGWTGGAEELCCIDNEIGSEDVFNQCPKCDSTETGAVEE